MMPSGCRACAYRPGLCHGQEGSLGLDGCITLNHDRCSELQSTCLCDVNRLYHRMREVGGFDCRLAAPLKPVPSPLPQYIPSYYYAIGGRKPFDLDWVALPLRTLLGSDGRFAIRCRSASEFRQSLCLRESTRIVITSPGPDQPLETFWRFHRTHRLFDAMLAMGVELFTVPNFSFFLDQPPLHHRYNRSRILRVAERASAAGLSAVLHLNALHEAEWRDWENLLREHTEIDTVCLEFQTGYKSPIIGDNAFNRLVALQKNVGRSLHPILVGGARYAERLGKKFASSTIIDGQPFMKTIRRRVCLDLATPKSMWKFVRTAPKEGLDTRWTENLRRYSARIKDRLAGMPAARQVEFPFHVGPKRLSGSCQQESTESLPLFAHVTRQRIETRDSAPPLSCGPASQLPDSVRSGFAKGPSSPRPISVTIPASSRRKGSPRRLQPSASVPGSREGEGGGR